MRAAPSPGAGAPFPRAHRAPSWRKGSRAGCGSRLEFLASGGVPDIDEKFSTGFRVAEPYEAGGGPTAFTGVGRADRDQVVLAGRPAEGSLVARAEKVADREDDRAPPLDLDHVVERGTQVGAGFLWFERQNIPEES